MHWGAQRRCPLSQAMGQEAHRWEGRLSWSFPNKESNLEGLGKPSQGGRGEGIFKHGAPHHQGHRDTSGAQCLSMKEREREGEEPGAGGEMEAAEASRPPIGTD